ncbi:hypothetical protein GCM10018772_11410 [Streptomyces fumanus]|uniref:Uncharacterized protein n=1 Tax=Streptomyces fumanus TaxID=67302 RepID=A0A919A5T7_9ACTN|nr:hypothetical protein GCM10018772_11410 [Streptomyces fumanus]
MKPKPFSELNHFTVPDAIFFSFGTVFETHTARVPVAAHDHPVGKNLLATTTATANDSITVAPRAERGKKLPHAPLTWEYCSAATANSPVASTDIRPRRDPDGRAGRG